MNTRTFKNMRGEWVTEESHALVPGSSWHLTISTQKVYSGAVVTRASVSQHDDHGCATHRVFTDYSKQLSAAKIRATEKSVKHFHVGAIESAGGLDMLLKAACAHLPEYTAQPVEA